MKVEFLSKNYRASDRLKDVVTEKLQRLDKYFEDDASVKVVLKKQNGEDGKGREGASETMEVTVKFGGNKLMRAETTTDNMYGNIDDIIPKLERQIRKFRTKISAKLRDNAFIDVPQETESVKDSLKIVKIKKFDISIVSVEDAVAEMELLGHNFYVFINPETNRVAVVYKRNDQSFGLIEPEY